MSRKITWIDASPCRRRASRGLVAIVLILCASAVVPTARGAPITIEFDFTFDTQNFFDSQEKINALLLAGHLIGRRLGDDLEAIVPAGVNTFDAIFDHPETGMEQSLHNLSVPADTVTIFVGGRDLGNATSLGFGGSGGFNSFGTVSWRETVRTRGEAGVDLNPATDFGPWGGWMSFSSNTGVSWHFGATLQGLDTGESDFLSVALHEIGHVLGFGTAESWDMFASATSFTGPASVAEYDLAGNVPLDNDESHWAEGTTDGGEETAMDPALAFGSRKLFTALDFAALDDVGWDLLPPPVPGDGTGDGGVDASDYTVWANQFGQTGVGVAGDYNDDLVVDAADYTVWANNFGAGVPSTLRAVPEPSTLTLGFAALVAMAVMTRRFKRPA